MDQDRVLYLKKKIPTLFGSLGIHALWLWLAYFHEANFKFSLFAYGSSIEKGYEFKKKRYFRMVGFLEA